MTKRRVINLLLLAVATVVVWVAFTVVMLWHRQERVVFQPPALVPDPPPNARRVEFVSSDGAPLYGFVVERRSSPDSRDRRGARTLVIAFHGNADLSAWLVPWAQELADRAEVTVFLPEYRGYGGIAGTPTYRTAANDSRGALAWARSEYPGARIVLFGHSLGSAIATELARDMRPEGPAALVLQSPFTSAQAMAARMLVPPIPALWSLISRVHYDTRDVVSSIDTPVWVSHGSRDVVIPARMGRSVHAAAMRKGELLLVPGAGHNDVADAGAASYWRWLTAAVSPREGAPAK